MIACRSCPPALAPDSRRASEPSLGARSGGPVFLTSRRPSAFAKRLVPELAGLASPVDAEVEREPVAV